MYGLTVKDVDLLSKCNDCMQGKQRCASHPLKSKKKGIQFGTQICSDSSSTQPVVTYGGGTVINVIIDEKTIFIWTKTLKSKADSTARMRNVTMQQLKGITVSLKTDQSGEYMSTEFGKLMEELGAEHSTSASGISQQMVKQKRPCKI